MKYGKRRQGTVGEEGRHFREGTLALLDCYVCNGRGGGGFAVLPGSVERGRRMSLRSVESVMTSSKAVTSDGDGVWGQKRRREEGDTRHSAT